MIIFVLQQEYDEAINIITEALDRVESILNKRILLNGDTIIETDIRLVVTLILRPFQSKYKENIGNDICVSLLY